MFFKGSNNQSIDHYKIVSFDEKIRKKPVYLHSHLFSLNKLSKNTN